MHVMYGREVGQFQFHTNTTFPNEKILKYMSTIVYYSKLYFNSETFTTRKVYFLQNFSPLKFFEAVEN